MDRRMLIIPLVLTALLVVVTLSTDEADGESAKVIKFDFDEEEIELEMNGIAIGSGQPITVDKLRLSEYNFIATCKEGYYPYRTLRGEPAQSRDFVLEGFELNSGTITLYLKPKEYKIKFDDTFGHITQIVCSFNDSFEVPAQISLRNGYSINTWHSDGRIFRSSEVVTIDEGLISICKINDDSIIVAPHVELVDYRGEYVLDGGTASFSGDSLWFNVESDVRITQYKPEKAGSIFKYWIIGETVIQPGESYRLSSSSIISDTFVVKIIAQWAAQITPVLEHCTYTTEYECADYGEAWSAKIVPDSHYSFQDEILLTGVTHVLNTDGSVTLSTDNVSCPISFTITATPIEHTVTFNSNGGSEVENLTFNEIDTQTFPTPTNGIYEFNGWFNGNNKIENTVGLDKDITVVAKWTPVYNVNFYNDWGGTPVKECTTKGSVTAPTDPTRSGYQFTGWSSSDGASFTGTVSKDTDYYAQWSAIYVPPTPTPVPTEPEPTVTFYLEEGGDVYMKCTSSELEELPTPTIEGYAFDYWYQRVDDEILEEFTGEFDEDIDVYAHWTAIMNRYHLYEGGDTWFEGYVCFERPTKDGYEFDSWYIIKDDQKVQFTEGLDLDVYASWKEKAVPPSSDGKINLILPIVAISLIVVMILGFLIYQKRLK